MSSTFPAPTGDYDDDLSADQRAKLEAAANAQPRAVPIRTAGATPVVSLPTWECPTHKIVVVQGDPCPKCGKKLLLG